MTLVTNRLICHVLYVVLKLTFSTSKKSGQMCRIKRSHTSGNVYSDKCWFIVLCQFWPHCSLSLGLTILILF